MSIGDLEVLFLTIPPFDQSTISSGSINIDRGTNRGSALMLIDKANRKKTILGCRIYSQGDFSCIPKNRAALYQGKNGKAWWYRARVNGVFTENRLLQLEVDGLVVINYEKQRDKYMEIRSNYFYIDLTLLWVSLVWMLILQFSNKNEIPNR